jgi:outer membrane protein OmpA-like peptidoglycan-associated protein
MQNPQPATIGNAIPLPEHFISFRKKTMLTLSFLFLIFIYTFGQGQKLIKTVYFEYDNYRLDDEEKNKIDSLLLDYKISAINIQGHCDRNGNNNYNDHLSMKRVRAVKEYLLSKEINDSIIHINAFGKRKPVNKNRNEDEMALNRRVEMEVDCIYNKTKPVIIQGNVFNDLNQPVIAEVSINDKDGNEIKSTTSDKSGKYTLNTSLLVNQQYTLNYYNENNFMSSQPIVVRQNSTAFRNLKTVLPELKKGKKYLFKNMNYFGNVAVMIPASKPSMEALLKLMKKNKKLVIQIEGHVNHPLYMEDRNNPEVIKFDQWLSDERSKMVYEYLVSHGIDENRLSKIGYGAKYMLYPNAVSDELMEQNRRVEINVIDF